MAEIPQQLKVCRKCRHFSDGVCRLTGLQQPAVGPAQSCPKSKWPANQKTAAVIIDVPDCRPRRSPEPARVPASATPQFPGRLAVCTAYFNPCNYRTREANFRRFAEAALSQGADLHVAAAGPVPHVDGVHCLDLGPCQTLWQKERAINVLIDQLPSDHDKVAWVDADLLFDNPHWVEDTSRQLEHVPVCQLFEWAVWLNQAGVPQYWRDYRRSLYAPSVPVVHAAGRLVDLRLEHPGFAWAARRETLDALGGLYDRHILGSGDSIMALGFTGSVDGHPFFEKFTPGPFRAACEAWCRKAFSLTAGRVGYVPGVVRHLWHGLRADRNYDGRLLRMAVNAIDPDSHLEPAENGLWRWSAECPAEIREFVQEYFYGRHEDGRPASGVASGA